MKITLESPMRMTLKDYNYTAFLAGLIFFAIGIWLIYLYATSMQPISILAPVMGAVFGLAGAYVLATTKIFTVVLDKGLNRCLISVLSVLKRETREIEMTGIKELLLQSHMETGSKGRRYHQYVLTFVRRNGEKIPFKFGRVSATIGASITNSIASSQEKKRKDAQQIADFLGVPLTGAGQPPVSGGF